MTWRLLWAHLSARTRESYADDVTAIARALDLSPDAIAARALESRAGCALMLREYLAATDGRFSLATQRKRVAAVRSLVTATADSGAIDFAPPRIELARPRATPRGLDVSGVRALLLAAGRALPLDEGARMYLAIRLGFDLGLRSAELLGAELDGIERGETTRLRVTRKGGHVSARTLPGPTVAALDAWLAVRPSPSSTRQILTSLGSGATRGGPWAPRSFRHQLARVARLALGRSISPHALRHAAVTAALAATNGDVRGVAAFAEHRDPSTTLLYDDDRSDHAGHVAHQLAAMLASSPRQVTLPLDTREPARELESDADPD